jgi:MATE family multidrug resistance protein
MFAASEGLIMSLLLVSVRHIWGYTYSDEEEVVAYVGKMLLLIAVSNFFDGIQSVLSGNTRYTTHLMATEFSPRLRSCLS